MRPSEALALHRTKVLEIIARYPVSNPRVFGSVARGEDGEASDIDILVDHQATMSTFDFARLELELEGALHSPVEVKTAADLSISVYRRVQLDLLPL